MSYLSSLQPFLVMNEGSSSIDPKCMSQSLKLARPSLPPHISAEDNSLMTLWNSHIPEQVNHCVHDLIAERCRQKPEAIAVHSWDGKLTYGELDALSSALAGRIVSHDLGEKRIIPLIFEKSMGTTIALLGALKAGAAFLLVDPIHPERRLREMCEISRVNLVIASEKHTDLAQKLVADVITLDQNELSVNIATTGCNLSPVSADSAAYCVFTSGSTGKPKGFCVNHNAFATMAATVPAAMNINSNSKVFAFASYAFDASVFEHLTCLIMGGTLCIPSDSARTNSLSNAVNEFQANFTILTPSVARILSPAQMTSLRTLVMTGEPMRKEDVDKWSSQLQLVNGYGPSECAVCCCVDSLVTSSTEPGLIGRPLGACLWLVDPHDHEKLVGCDAVGEILIEGNTVGKGYLADREQTAATFIDAPKWLQEFRSGTCGQVYKTGDLAEYRRNGTLRLLGRKDTQVKIRGQRVELLDIEQKLRDLYDERTEVVVEAIDSDKPVLVAFVHHGNLTETTEDFLSQPDISFYNESRSVQGRLLESLPSYMIPSIFFPLAYIPVIVTGKVDRRRLRLAAEALSAHSRAFYKNPLANCSDSVTSPIRDSLRKLWAKVLDVSADTIGPNDNFIELGGTSIDAMKLVELCRKAGYTIQVSSILVDPGLHQMSLVIETQQDKVEIPPPSFDLDNSLREELMRQAKISHTDVVDIFPTTEFQRWNLKQPCDHLAIEIPVDVDIIRLEDAWKRTIAKHAALRIMFLPYKNQILQVVLKKWDLGIEEIVTQDDPAVIIEALTSQNSRQYPPAGTFHCRLTLLSGQNSRLLLVQINHAQYDGVSLQTLYNDLKSAYSGQELTPSKDFPDYMRYRIAQYTPKAFAYWREALDRATMTVLSQPQLSLPKDLVIHMKDIPSLSPPKGITLATLFTSAWAWTLAAVTGQFDIVFGYVSSGRDIPMNNAVGFVGSAVTTVPMRLTFQQYWTVSDLLKELQQKRILNSSYEVIDFEDIVSQSTSWPAGTQLGSVFSYEEFGGIPELSLDDIHCPSRFLFQKTPNVPYALVSPSDGKIGVRVAGRADFLPQIQAVRLCEMICSTVKMFAQYPERNLPWESLTPK